MLTDFQIPFTVGLRSNCVTAWSLKILPHLKRVATLPCETLVFKNWITTLILLIHQLQIIRLELINRIIANFRHLKWFDYICCDIIFSYLIDSALIVVIFSASCVYPDIPCIIRYIQSESATILRDPYKLPDFWLLNSPTVDYTIWGNESIRKKRRMWMIWGSVWLMCAL